MHSPLFTLIAFLYIVIPVKFQANDEQEAAMDNAQRSESKKAEK